MNIRLRIISLGAGVQSTTMALMAAHGEIGPMPDCAIFADTQQEPATVYDHLRWMMEKADLPFPIYIVSKGDLGLELERKVGIPAYVQASDGRWTPANRSCTGDYKIDPIRRKVRELLGLTHKRSPAEPVCEQWLGISTDEAGRMKPSQETWLKNRWPLIEMNMSRWDCLRWLEKRGYPNPPKSSCIFCPYHSDDQWRALTKEEFAEAVRIDELIRDKGKTRGKLYLHRSGAPLRDVDLSTAEDRGQLNMFNNECFGGCGV